MAESMFEWQTEVIEAFGLDPENVLEFTLHITGDAYPAVTVKLTTSEWPEIESVTQRFKLVPAAPSGPMTIVEAVSILETASGLVNWFDPLRPVPFTAHEVHEAHRVAVSRNRDPIIDEARDLLLRNCPE